MMHLSRTMRSLANSQPIEEKRARELCHLIACQLHPDRIMAIRGRSERLRAKHELAAIAARDSAPTPRGTWGEVCQVGSTRLGRRAIRLADVPGRRDQRKRLSRAMRGLPG
jgi:hypothetical protein